MPRGGVEVQLSFFNLGTRWGWVVDAKPWPLYPLERDLVPIVLEAGSWQGQKILPQPGFDPWAIWKKGDSWHTFDVIIFHILFVLIKFNVTAHVGSNTLRLQSDLHKFDVIHKGKGGKGFFPNLCTCANFPCRWCKLAYGKNTWKIKMTSFQGVEETDND